MSISRQAPRPGAGAEWLARGLDRVLSKRAAKAFAGLGLATVEDLLRHFPRRYEEAGRLTDLGSLGPGEHVTVLARVVDASLHELRSRPGYRIAATVADLAGHTLDLAFFFRQHHTAQYNLAMLAPGRQGLFTGTVGAYGGKAQLTHPDKLMVGESEAEKMAAILDIERPIPIYPAAQALPSWKIHQSVQLVLGSLPAEGIGDPLPPAVLSERGLRAIVDALNAIHCPRVDADWREARKRFRFEEAFTLQVALARRRAQNAAQPATARPAVSGGALAAFDARLPFELTDSQRRVGREIGCYLGQDHPMQRLLQGDVGSGKTVVALRAMLQVVDAGGQAALLAPTEVLATQHLRTVLDLLGPLAREGLEASRDRPVRVRLLTGSLGAAAKRETLADAAAGEADMVIGTHALLSDPVQFADLGLVVVDEQHRFGVEQRDALRTRGEVRPHLLVMTATPIPRSVAMTVFGDLEVSVLDQLPAGRPAVATHVVPVGRPSWMARVWQRVREEADAGHRVFVVCPRISAQVPGQPGVLGQPGFLGQPGGQGWDLDGRQGELGAEEGPEGEAVAGEGAADLANVEETVELFAQNPVLRPLRAAALHGGMRPEAKDRIMREFAAGKVQVLIATVVVEVGIDVPEATAMVVLDADRFGLAQLHQMRGRVGRGTAPGVCLLVSRAQPGTPAA
ncbi:MAG: ATP-dependent DNA helicase RecG, partial [Bifidobacteriaceae bacterium]|nr:ATP-dependent DNA helicase RecG [Bifidobacteriaceae bacterium]